MQDGGAVSSTAHAWLPFVLLNYYGASKMLLFSLQLSVLQPLLYFVFFIFLDVVPVFAKGFFLFPLYVL